MMPGMDGIELARLVRMDPEIAGVKLVLLTSAGRPDDATLWRSLSISACLTKPVRQSELFDALMYVMNPLDGCPNPLTSRQSTESSLAPLAAQPQLRILLAEDHPVNQMVATRMLERLGHKVVVATDGSKAITALEESEFDAVFMDVQMPEIDGFEALRIIRTREKSTGKHVPIVALTAHAMQGDRERCLLAGFDDYLAKPIVNRDLEAALDSLINQFRRTPDARHPVLDELISICEGDTVFSYELAESFLESAPRCLSGIETALELGDPVALSSHAHALRGIAATIGAVDLSTLCAELEDVMKRRGLEAAPAVASRVNRAWDQVRTALEQHVPAGTHR
jgi:CheY-like chemotaxis protein